MVINMKKNIRTLGMVVGLGFMSASMSSCFSDADVRSISADLKTGLTEYIDSQSKINSSNQTTSDVSSDLSSSLTDYLDSDLNSNSNSNSNSKNNYVSSLKDFSNKEHVISGSSIKRVTGISPTHAGVSSKKVKAITPTSVKNKKASLSEYKLNCDLLGVDYNTKIFSLDALNFPRSSSYVTTYPAYEQVLLPAILARVKTGMSQKDAVFDVYSSADNDKNNAITFAEAKVFSHTDSYVNK